MGYCAVNSNDIYLSGRTTSFSQSVLTTLCSYQAASGGGFADALLSKFDFKGNRLWSTIYGGNGTVDSSGVSCDASNNVYLTGATNSNNGTIMASSGSQQSNYGGGISDGFIAKFDGCIPVSPMNTNAVQNLTICSRNNTVLNASLTCGAQWYSAPTVGTLLISGSNFTTPILTSNTTFYFEESSCGVAAPRTPVTVTAQICTSIESIELPDKSLIVYPNPSRDKIYIDCTELLSNLFIFNSIGQQVAEVHLSHTGISEVDVSNLATGIYFLQTTLTDKVVIMKIIIEE